MSSYSDTTSRSLDHCFTVLQQASRITSTRGIGGYTDPHVALVVIQIHMWRWWLYRSTCGISGYTDPHVALVVIQIHIWHWWLYS